MVVSSGETVRKRGAGRRKPLTIHTQLLLAMSLLVLLVTVAFSLFVYLVQRQALMKGIDMRLRSVAIMAQAMLPADYHDRITGPDSIPDAQYQAIVDKYNMLCQKMGLEYLWSLMEIGGKIVFTSATSPDKITANHKHAAFFETHSNPELYTSVFETMQPTYQVNDDKWGRIRVALIPFRDHQGRPYLFGASMRLTEVDRKLHRIIDQCLTAILLLFAISLGGAMILARSVVWPIRRLTETIQGIAQGDASLVAEERGSYEQVVLARNFNLLNQALQDKIIQSAQQEADLRITLQSIGDAVITTDAAGCVTRMNPVAEQLTGWPQAEALGRPLADVFRIINARTREAVENPVNKVLRHGHVVGLANHTALIARDGMEWQIADSAAPIRTADGVILGVVMVFHDVTEQYRMQEALRESEHRYRMVADFNHDWEFWLTQEGRLAYCSPSCQRITGYAAEDFQSDPGLLLRILHPADLPRFEEHQRCLAQACMTSLLEFRIIRSDGAERWIEHACNPVYDENGQWLGARGSNRDITERKLAEETQLRLEEQLRQAHKMEAVGQLAGGVAHDFNNMLTPILGYAELLLDELPETDGKREGVEEILKAATSAADLTRQLLAFGRKQALEMKPLDLNQVIGSLDKMLRRTLREDIEIQRQLAPGAANIIGDVIQLQQVLLNLAVNAQDAMPGGGRITIRTEAVPLNEAAAAQLSLAPGRYVALMVGDTGAGMAPEILPRIFEPFFTTKEKGRGTGLGLSVVYGIVQQHGGAITAVSEPGRGTAFTIYFPRAEAGAAGVARAATAPSAHRGHEVVLVVEDQAQVRDLAVRVLRKNGYQVLSAEDGAQALELAAKFIGKIDLLLSDVVMPGMSGKELYERLSASCPALKVLYMSGYAETVIAHHGILEPGVQYIQKPFTVEGLAARVRQALEGAD